MKEIQSQIPECSTLGRAHVLSRHPNQRCLLQLWNNKALTLRKRDTTTPMDQNASLSS